MEISESGIEILGPLTHSEMEALVRRFQGVSVAVIGDLILDEFVWGRVRRISPEAPVPVVEIEAESERLGGAANVALNVAALGGRPQLIGIVGDDLRGRHFLERMEEAGLDRSGVVRVSGRRTTTKTRVVAHHQQVCRTDREDCTELGSPHRKELLDCVVGAGSEVQGIIVSDYAKGVVSDELLPELSRSMPRGTLIAVDPKSRDFSRYSGCSLITPNQREAEEASGISIRDRRSLLNAGRVIREQTGCDDVLVTQGEEGMTLLEGERLTHIPTAAREVFDVTGAGDTVIAVLLLAAAGGADLRSAAFAANQAAGVVVGKLGTATVSLEELLQSLE